MVAVVVVMCSIWWGAAGVFPRPLCFSFPACSVRAESNGAHIPVPARWVGRTEFGGFSDALSLCPVQLCNERAFGAALNHAHGFINFCFLLICIC